MVAAESAAITWGTAIDLLLNGKLDVRGNKKVFFGLSQIAPISNRRGWYWGAQFRTTEDAMRFEVGNNRLELWKSSGQLVASSAKTLRRVDKGSAVHRLQAKLNKHGAKLALDGDFSVATESAVGQFQLADGLGADGIVDPKTNKALGIN